MTTLQHPQAEAVPVPAPLPRARDTSVVSEVVKYMIVGVPLGVILVKSQVISWYRIQEMFRFQSFHMYGILGSAMITALISMFVLRWTEARALSGERVSVPHKELGRGYRYWIGGTIFGAGWALTGACPGPLFALIGSGATVFAVTALAALAGTWTYGWLRPRLPH